MYPPGTEDFPTPSSPAIFDVTSGWVVRLLLLRPRFCWAVNNAVIEVNSIWGQEMYTGQRPYSVRVSLGGVALGDNLWSAINFTRGTRVNPFDFNREGNCFTFARV